MEMPCFIHWINGINVLIRPLQATILVSTNLSSTFDMIDHHVLLSRRYYCLALLSPEFIHRLQVVHNVYVLISEQSSGTYNDCFSGVNE